MELELERLRSGMPVPPTPTPTHRPMITHISDSHQIPIQNKTKSELQILKNVKNSNVEILQGTLHATHLLK